MTERQLKFEIAIRLFCIGLIGVFYIVLTVLVWQFNRDQEARIELIMERVNEDDSMTQKLDEIGKALREIEKQQNQ